MDDLSLVQLAVLAAALLGGARTAEDVATELGFDIEEVLRACGDLEAAGYLTWTSLH
jgi:hypothetical protein